MMIVLATTQCFPSPVCPDSMDWSSFYPHHFPPAAATDRDREPIEGQHAVTKKAKVEFADVGCGYGGLLGENMQHNFWCI